MLAPRAEAAGAAAAGAGAPVPAADAAPGAAPDDGAAPGHATRALVALGAVAFCVLFGEGAMADWSAVYLRDVAGAGPGLAAVGYAAFSLTMAGGRLVGDRLTERLGPARLVRGGGLLAAAGLAAALVSGAPWAAVAGFGFVGAGLSTVFPVALAAAGRLTGRSAGGAIATVASCGYAGFLVGPPLIGFVAHAASLRAGLGLVVGTSAAIALLAGALRRHRAPRPAPALAGA
jgi:MFS family permease